MIGGKSFTMYVDKELLYYHIRAPRNQKTNIAAEKIDKDDSW